MTDPLDSKYADIYTIVAAIPEGRVATYGQIARLSNRPNGARQIGYALAANKDTALPWHRVINSQGRISARADSGYEDYQRLLLEEEGVEFSLRGAIDLSIFQWDGRE